MKKNRRYALAALLLILPLLLQAADRKDRHIRDTLKYPDAYLDTVQVNKVFTLNDYMLIGVEAGFGFNSQMFNPSFSQSWRMFPEHYEVTFTRYGKMFGYMPYFGFKFGAAYSHEGYKMKMNEETGFIGSISGATECQYDVAEILFLSHFHYDLPNFKIIADLGPYGGKRMNIERIGDNVLDVYRYSFIDTDRQIDYGIRAAAGFALVFDPVELHITAKVRYSFSNLYEPDYLSKYYYSYAYPLDIMVTAGLHFQLSKKSGKTTPALKKEARTAVYGEQK